jgi:hypothetical protein
VAQTQALNQVLIAPEIFISQILQQFAAFANHYQQPSAGMKIFFVDFHVFGELSYPRRENSHLYLGGAGVGSVRLVPLDYLRFQFFVDHLIHSQCI